MFGEVIGISVGISVLTQYVADSVKLDVLYVLIANFLACMGAVGDLWFRYYRK
jgi:hypothetical protein